MFGQSIAQVTNFGIFAVFNRQSVINNQSLVVGLKKQCKQQHLYIVIIY